MAHTTHVDEKQARAVAEEAREAGWSKPSFCKELFLGRFPLDLIHPHPRPDPSRSGANASSSTALEAYCATLDGAVIERESRIPDEYVKGLADLGCFGIKIPAEYGGLGMSQVTYGRALMLVGSVHASLGALLSAHQSIGVPEPLKLAGTPEQKRAFLPRCARGAVSAFLLTEPDVGSDPARLRTSATPTEDGHYVLDGTKLWTTNGVVAELLVVMARVPEARRERGGIAAFVVEADAPGHHRRTPQRVHGPARDRERGHATSTRCACRPRTCIGKENDGLRIALATLNTGRLSLPAVCAAGGEVELSRSPANGRPSASSGAGRSVSMPRSPARSRSSRRLRSRWRRCSTCPASSPTRAARTSASRPRSRSCGLARWAR